MDHITSHRKGSDPRNHVGRCTCGYAYSGTFKAVSERMAVHKSEFTDEHRAWNDPRRLTQMPLAAHSS